MTNFRVLSAELAHETNTFSKIPTTFAHFESQECFLDAATAIAERGKSNTELAGFLDAARAHGWDMQHALSANAQPAGRVTRDAFERLTAPIVAAAAQRVGQLDGILLALHGAMVTEDHDDGEGELLSRLRAVVGSTIPIAITLDLHANVTEAMCRHASIIVSYRTYPHVDMRDTGRRAADILQRAMAGEIEPVTVRAHLPMLDEVNGGRTDVGDMLPRLARARAYEEQADVFAVSINAGFARADIGEIGPTVLVTAQGDLEHHQAFAQELADSIWSGRHTLVNRFLSVEEAATRCAAHDGKAGPLVVADYADNPGGGGYGDATALLKGLLDVGVRRACFGPMVDPQTVQALQHTPIGAVVSVLLGGKTDARLGGAPLALTGSLELKSDGRYFADGPMTGGQHRTWGPTVVLRVQDIDILVVSLPAQILDLAQFTSFGIDPASRTVVALKSMQHFRAAFEPIAAEVIVCDSGALCTPDLAALPYQNLPRPIFPLDRDIDLEAWRTAQHGADPALAVALAVPPRPAGKTQARDVALPVLEQLAAWYPQLFGAVFRPLKRGIFQDLMQAHPAALERESLKAALALHTRSTRYLTVVASGERRHDLAGQVVEDMAPEHVFQALVEVFRRRQVRSSEDLAPRLRERITQAFEASGLAPDAYAALVRGRGEVVNALLDAALSDAAQRGAKDEALLRAFDASGQPVEAFADMYGMDSRLASRMLERARRRLANA
ncbi:MAG: M81 family metallopeptidase [Rhodoferax sp.]|nr:M81 family metallopeptidase [Rhodoferax sp.]